MAAANAATKSAGSAVRLCCETGDMVESCAPRRQRATGCVRNCRAGGMIAVDMSYCSLGHRRIRPTTLCPSTTRNGQKTGKEQTAT